MPTSSADVALLLRRAHFGGTRPQIDALAALPDRAAVVDAVLATAPAYAGPPMPDPAAAPNLWEAFVSLIQWWMDRCAHSTTPIVEKMTMFWHGLFTTSINKVFNPPFITAQHAFYREHAVGDLRTLVHGMALQPAMLDYLDNAWSGWWAPNQNFARELMELFLLGVGNYTEADVDAAAAAWTGHGFDEATTSHLFRPDWHDHGVKTFLGHTGALDGPDTIDIMLTDPAVAPVMARWIARKLWEFFAHPNPPAPVVDAVATALLRRYAITDALRVLFNRPEFYQPASVNGHVRSPIEYVVAVLRALPGVDAALIHPEWFLDDMGQMPFNPPTVEGWKHNGFWVSTAAAEAKARFAQFASWVLDEAGLHPFAGTRALAVPDAVQFVLDTLHITSPSPATRAVLESFLVANRADGDDWFEPVGLFVAALLSPDLQIG
jgi:uncharacterized protein (DUF1800 family)